MKDLSRTETRRLEAAEGWALLGNPEEAIKELEQLNPHFRLHPQVLSVRWEVYSKAGWWESAWAVSDILCRLMPLDPRSWICQANSLRAFKGVKSAYDLLVQVARHFSNEALIAYNLGCYSAQLGANEEACRWLIRAFEIDASVQLKITALQDPDLESLWQKIDLFGQSQPSASPAPSNWVTSPQDRPQKETGGPKTAR